MFSKAARLDLFLTSPLQALTFATFGASVNREAELLFSVEDHLTSLRMAEKC